MQVKCLKWLKWRTAAVKMDLISAPKEALNPLVPLLVTGKETTRLATTIAPTSPEIIESKETKESQGRLKIPSTQNHNQRVEMMISNPVPTLIWALKAASTLLVTSPVTPLKECLTQR